MPPPATVPRPADRLQAWGLVEAEQAAVRVDRALTELLHARPIALTEGAGRPWALVLAVEPLGAARWAAGEAGRTGALVLSAERWQALGLAVDRPQAVDLPPGCGLEALQALSAVQRCPDDALRQDPAGLGTGWPPEALEALRRAARPAPASAVAALELVKRRGLVPAVLLAEQPADTLPDALAAGLLALPLADLARAAPGAGRRGLLRRVSEARVPIEAHEDCTLVLFREEHGEAEHLALVVGRPDFAGPVAVRLHSSCFTGDLLGSLRCDCGDQLQRAVDHLAVEGGVLLYLAQEGRGTGLASKLRAYRLQDLGFDTLDADRHLGFRGDERDFGLAAALLEQLGVRRIRLLTNNPAKIQALRAAGVEVLDRIPLQVAANPHNARYLATKRDRAGHQLREDEQD